MQAHMQTYICSHDNIKLGETYIVNAELEYKTVWKIIFWKDDV
jgi:hypothetical protein